MTPEGGNSTSTPPRGWRRWARSTIRTATWLLVFASAAVGGVILHLDLPASRRLAARLASDTLADLLEGRIEVGSFEELGLLGLRARHVRVYDPQGNWVALVDSVRGRYRATRLLRDYFFGEGDFTLLIDHVRLDGAGVLLLPNAYDVPTLVDAFRVRDSTPDTPAERPLIVALPIIEVGNLHARTLYGEAPSIHIDLQSARGSLLATPERITVDFERFGIHAAGPEPWTADGLASLHIRAPGAMWTHFDGQLGDVPLHAFARLEDDDRVEARIELPQVTQQAARSLIPDWPIETTLALRLTATGRLPDLDTTLTAELAQGTLLAQGAVTLEDGIAADLDIETQNIDLSRIDADLPTTAIESRGAILLWSDGTQVSAELNGTIQPGEIEGVATPGIDFRSTYDPDGLALSATLHERGIPAHLEAQVSPEGEVTFQGHVPRARLENSPRLAAWLGASRGTVELEVSGSVHDGRLDGTVELRGSRVSWRDLGLGQTRMLVTAQGPWKEPGSLRLDAKLQASEFRLGAIQLERLETTSRGTPQQFDVELHAEREDGARLRGSARVTPAPLVVEGARLSVLHDDLETSAHLRRGTIRDDQVKLEGVRIQSQGTLQGSVSWTPGRYEIEGRGAGVNLGQIADALGLPRVLLDGRLSLAGALRLSTNSTGKLAIDLQNGSLGELRDVHLQGFVELDGRTSRGNLTGGIASLGRIAASWDARLAGNAARPQSWLDATGQAQLAFEDIDLQAVQTAFELPGVRDASGSGYARLSLARTGPDQLPQALFLVGTQRLGLSLEREEEVLRIDGVDVGLAGALEGGTGKLAATGRVFDYRGDIMTVGTEIEANWENVWRALAQGRSPWPMLADRPLRAVLIVPYRSLDQLPAFLRPAGYEGQGSARAVVMGTLGAPDINLTVTAHHVTGQESPFMVPVDVESTVRYSFVSGALQGTVRASRNRAQIARGTFDLVVPGRNVLDTPRTDAPLWTGNAQLVLDGMPLELLDALAERRLRGSAQGSVLVSRSGWVPLVRAALTLQRLEIDGVTVGEGRVIADTSEDAVLARAHFEDEAGSLTASVRAGVHPTPLGLDFVEKSPVRMTVEARHYDARLLSPFVRDVLAELSGTLNGTLHATLEPAKASEASADGLTWDAHLGGRMRLTGGVIEPAAVGLRLLDAQLTLEARREGEYNIIAVNDLEARANSNRPNFRASGMVYLRNLDIEHARFDVEQQAVPFSSAGVRLADLTGVASAVVERRDEEMAVSVEVPRMLAELPTLTERPLIELEDNPDVEVLQPLGPVEEETDGEGPAKPWHVRFRLGDDVRVRSRLINVRLRGGPELRIAEEVRVSGTVELVPGGRITVLGRTFVIDHGRITFDPERPSDPALDLTATWRAPNGVLVMANVRGTAEAPELHWNSDPGLPGGEAEVVGLVLGTGGGESREGTTGAGIAAAVVNELLGQVTPARFEFYVSRETGGGEGQVASLSERRWQAYTASYQISDEVWVEGSVLQPQDTTGAVNEQEAGVSGAIDWRFHPDWSLRTEAGTLGVGTDLLWRYRY